MSWKTHKISDLGIVIGGATPSTSKRENYENGNISWITPKDLSEHKERFIFRGKRNITEVGLKSCAAQLMPKNTILFSSRAPIGYVAIAAQELCTNQGFKSIIPNEKVDFMFLYYLLVYYKKTIEGLGTGTTFKEISGGMMKNIEVCIPEDLATQQKIASILSVYDDLIENNRKQIKLLEEAAQRLYKEWFVDLRFPGHENVKIINGVPEGWSSFHLSDVISYEIGGGWGEENAGKNEIPAYVIRGTDFAGLTNGEILSIPLRFHTNNNLAARMLEHGDIVFEVSGGSRTEGSDLHNGLKKPAWTGQYLRVL